MNSKFKIEGVGETIAIAESSLGKDRDSRLISKLRDAKVSTDLNVSESIYKGIYNLKGECKASACATHLEIESHKGWGPITDKAERQLVNIDAYKTQFQVEQYIKLTAEQQKALTPSRPPAERTQRESSCIDYLVR
jgi:hypothetical protein